MGAIVRKKISQRVIFFMSKSAKTVLIGEFVLTFVVRHIRVKSEIGLNLKSILGIWILFGLDFWIVVYVCFFSSGRIPLIIPETFHGRHSCFAIYSVGQMAILYFKELLFIILDISLSLFFKPAYSKCIYTCFYTRLWKMTEDIAFQRPLCNLWQLLRRDRLGKYISMHKSFFFSTLIC